MIHAPLDREAVPAPSDYPVPLALARIAIDHAVLAVAFHDTLLAGHLPGPTASLLTNTFLQALLLGKVLDTTDSDLLDTVTATTETG